jgi:ABC-type bacteriocin/lantibiotic exporter with double-glycine peptidase domain
MDDPISALDANVRKCVFKEVLLGTCKNKTRVLVTHALGFLHLCDRIAIVKNGQITTIGSY